VGAVVADDVAHLVTHPLLRDHPERILTVGGTEPLRSLYAAQLGAAWRGRVVMASAGDTAAALGAALVARRRWEW
jgi:activator of 2-hydroxyglutaryl-CoA dehydratase